MSRRIGGNRTDAWFDIWVELGQPSANQAFLGDIANEAMRNYFAGNWINAMWFTSSNINREGGTAGTAGVFHSEAIALDTRRPPRFEPERDASARSWELNLTMGYAVGVRRADYGVQVLSDLTTPTTV